MVDCARFARSWLCFPYLLPVPRFSIPLLTGAYLHKPSHPPINRLISSISSFCVNQINTEYETAPRAIQSTSTSAGGRWNISCCNSTTTETIMSEPAAAGTMVLTIARKLLSMIFPASLNVITSTSADGTAAAIPV